MAVLTDSVSVSVPVHLRSKPLLKRILKKAPISAFFIGFIFSWQAQSKTNHCPQLNDIAPNQLTTATVKWVVDGDTLHTEQGEKLRLLHINAPEINPKSTKPAEPYALDAKAKLRQLAGKGRTIYWLSDSRAQDKYGRTLALVFNDKQQFVNAELIAAGLAHTLVLPPNDKYWQCIKTAEIQAAKATAGIWSDKLTAFITPSQAKPKQGFQLIRGQISQIKDSRRYRWLILQQNLWVGIPRQRLDYFNLQAIQFKVGEQLAVRGYVYHSHGKKRLKLNHPAMLYQDFAE